MVLMPTHPSNEKSNYHSIRFLTKHSFLKFVHKYFIRILELFVEVIFTHFINVPPSHPRVNVEM